MYSIPNPCHENWDKMTPAEKGRFCAVCQKTVVDFEQKSTQEALLLLAQEKSLCVRISQYQLNTLNRKLKALQYLKQIGFLSSTVLLMSYTTPASAQVTSSVTVIERDTSSYNSSLIADLSSSFHFKERISPKAYSIPRKDLSPILTFDKMPPENLAVLYGQYIEDLLVAHHQQDTIAIEEYQTAFIAIEKQLNLSFPTFNSQIDSLIQTNKGEDTSVEILAIKGKKLLYLSKYLGEKQVLYMLIGYFIEGLHTSLLEYDNYPTETTKVCIGDYKMPLEHIILVLDIFKTNSVGDKELYKDMLALRDKFEKLSIIIKTRPVGLIDDSGRDTIIVEKYSDTHSIKVTDSDFQEILKTAKLFVATYRIVK